MISDHLRQLRDLLQESDNLPAATKAELLRLVSAAEAESHGTETTEGEVSSAENEGEGTVLDQLKASIEELETSHPEATSLVNRVATVLANMGI